MSDDSSPTGLSRLSMSLPTDLFYQLDLMVQERGLPSRSQLISELIRNALADHGEVTHPSALLAGTITLVYRANVGRVREQIAQKQHEYLKEVVSAQHVFLEDEQSLEVLLVQGPAARLRDFCDALRKVRGVQQLHLFTTTALLPPLHEQVSFKSAKARTAA